MAAVPEAFYPFVENDEEAQGEEVEVRFSARIAVYDDAAAAPRVVIIEPKDVRSYLEEITATVTKLAKEQGGGLPFMVIREIVENLIHAYFTEPAISILDGGDTIRFADQGPGIANKDLALEYGTTSATGEMKRYIRGVGSGLPYAQQWLSDKGGTLKIEDNISRGTVVTISLVEDGGSELGEAAGDSFANAGGAAQGTAAPTAAPMGYGVSMPPSQMQAPAPSPQAGWAAAMPAPWQAMPSAPAGWWPQGAYAPQAAPMPQMPANSGYAPAGGAAISERGKLALGYLAMHESVGPKELVDAYGLSQSTWTRELKALEDKGLVTKRGGQKRFLTPAGQAFLTQ